MRKEEDLIETYSPLNGLRRLFSHLSARRRWQLAGLIVAMMLGAVAELATLGAVLPFLALLAAPTSGSNYPLLQKMFSMLGWSSAEQIILPVVILFSAVSLGAAVVRMFLSWASYKWIFGVGADLGIEVYRRTLYQPYMFHVAHNTSEIIAGINKAQLITVNVINPLIQIGISIVLSLAVLAALIFIDPVSAVAAGLGFTLIYLLVTLATRHALHANGKIIADAETRRIQAIQEGLGGIRDVIIDGAQRVYVRRFWSVDVAQRRAQGLNSFISVAPRYLIELIGMVLIAALAYWLSLRQGGLAAAIPVLGALAIGAQKLFPLMQQIYYSWATLSGSLAHLQDALALLDQPIPDEYSSSSRDGALRLKNHIALHNIGFRYRNDGPDIIRTLSLEIPRGGRVGFIGKTGGGKSTLLDLIMGLLEPTEGRIEIDGQPLTSMNRRAWQARIAHVPQAIYLADATIAENIAFGIDAQDIDQGGVRAAAMKAQLAEFIEELPEGYATVVGERGIRLSGGQRQRIGLARALYKHADVLVLDEATSSLDDATEGAVMRVIDLFGQGMTVLMVAHRVSTLRNCDRIFEIENGRLRREGSYQELIEPLFVAQK